MQERQVRFGDFIKRKRMDDQREVTLSDLSKVLGISLSLLSEIENHRRRPFGMEKIEIFARYFDLTTKEIALMYDLASNENGEIPSDIEEILMHKEVGNMARFALRQSKAGNVTEADWKRFIREIENKKNQKGGQDQ